MFLLDDFVYRLKKSIRSARPDSRSESSRSHSTSSSVRVNAELQKKYRMFIRSMLGLLSGQYTEFDAVLQSVIALLFSFLLPSLSV